MKKTLILFLVLGVVIFGVWYFNQISPETSSDIVLVATDPRNATYIIDNKPVTLIDGYAEVSTTPESVPKVITKYFGNEVRTDLDNDGREDVSFLVTQEAGGTGTFFYVVAALNTEKGWVGSHAIFIGDRIAPQTTEVSRNKNHKDVIVVNYADRAPNEPMTTPASQGKSLYLKLDPESMQFGEVVANFEGEADPSQMTLDMKTWTWVKTNYNNDTELIPSQANAFTITFNADNTISITTDCNSMSGSYEIDKNNITFGPMVTTLMFCEGSQEQDFAKMLAKVQSFFFTSRGELVFDLEFDSGSSVFQ